MRSGALPAVLCVLQAALAATSTSTVVPPDPTPTQTSLPSPPTRTSPIPLTPTLVPVLPSPAATPTQTVVDPHLAVALTFLAHSDELLQGFPGAIARTVASRLAVSIHEIGPVTVADNKEGKAVASFLIYAPVMDLPVLKERLEQSVERGLRVGGVQVEAAAVTIYAPGVVDECKANPCGEDQTCSDSNHVQKGDFVCSCGNGAREYLGRPAPRCTAPLDEVTKAAGIFEALTLSSGTAGVAAVRCAMLHVTQCMGRMEDLPPLLHPTGVELGGSPHAGCVAANMAIIVGVLLLQFIGVALVCRVKNVSSGRAKVVLGFPDVPLRLSVILIPSAVFSSVSLLNTTNPPVWNTVLGVLSLSFLGIVLAKASILRVSRVLPALGPHKWDPHDLHGPWVRVDPVARGHMKWFLGSTLVLAFFMATRPSSAEGCAGQKLVAGVGLFIYAAVVMMTRPWRAATESERRHGDSIDIGVTLVQVLAWVFLAVGNLRGSHHWGLEAGIALRLVVAVFLFMWMTFDAFVEARYLWTLVKSGGDLEGAVPGGPSCPGRVEQGMLLLSDATWLFLSVAAAHHWGWAALAGCCALARLIAAVWVLDDSLQGQLVTQIDVTPLIDGEMIGVVDGDAADDSKVPYQAAPETDDTSTASLLKSPSKHPEIQENPPSRPSSLLHPHPPPETHPLVRSPPVVDCVTYVKSYHATVERTAVGHLAATLLLLSESEEALGHPSHTALIHEAMKCSDRDGAIESMRRAVCEKETMKRFVDDVAMELDSQQRLLGRMVRDIAACAAGLPPATPPPPTPPPPPALNDTGCMTDVPPGPAPVPYDLCHIPPSPEHTRHPSYVHTRHPSPDTSCRRAQSFPNLARPTEPPDPTNLRRVSSAHSSVLSARSSSPPSVRGQSVGSIPSRCSVLLQSDGPRRTYIYTRCYLAASKASEDTAFVISIEASQLIHQFSTADIQRCGGQEAQATEYPNRALYFLVAADTGTLARIVVIFRNEGERGKWLLWLHRIRPEAAVLPSELRLPSQGGGSSTPLLAPSE